MWASSQLGSLKRAGFLTLCLREESVPGDEAEAAFYGLITSPTASLFTVPLGAGKGQRSAQTQGKETCTSFDTTTTQKRLFGASALRLSSDL